MRTPRPWILQSVWGFWGVSVMWMECVSDENRWRLRGGRFARQSVEAGRGNRTLVFSLEGYCSTIELHPRLWMPRRTPCRSRPRPRGGRDETGECRIRTCEGISHQIYSLTPLTARETPLWCTVNSSSRVFSCLLVAKSCEWLVWLTAGLGFRGVATVACSSSLDRPRSIVNQPGRMHRSKPPPRRVDSRRGGGPPVPSLSW